MRKLLTLALGSALSLSACTDIEYAISLEEDLSGTAVLDMAMDVERLAIITASIQKAFTGDTTPLSDEELAVAREELIAQLEKDDWDEEESMRKSREELPEGVEILEFSNTRDDLMQRFRVRLAFDHVASLNEVEIDPDDATGEGGGAPGGEAQPFGGLRVIEEGNTIVIRNDPLDPIEEQAEDAAQQMPGMEGIVNSVLADFSLVFRIEAPFDVVEDNATRREGNALIWEYDETSLEEGSAGVFVRYER